MEHDIADSFVIREENVYKFVCRRAGRHDEQRVLRPQADFSGYRSWPATELR